MNTILALVAFLAACSAADPTPTEATIPDEECKKAAMNGMLEVGCWGYKECRDNVLYTHRCPDGQVLIRDTLQCVPKGQSGGECDKDTDCLGKPDAMYVNLENCQSYYRCAGSVNIGKFYCPVSLVFNEKFQTCDYPSNVPVPCGTAPSA